MNSVCPQRHLALKRSNDTTVFLIISIHYGPCLPQQPREIGMYKSRRDATSCRDGCVERVTRYWYKSRFVSQRESNQLVVKMSVSFW